VTVSTSCIQFSDGSIDSAAVAEIADNRAVIDQAKGMLILLYGVDDESAFDMLRRRSQSTNVKLRALAGQLVSDYGVLVAIALSIADLLRRVARPHDAIQGFVPGVAGMHHIDDYPEADLVPGLLVYRYDAPLFFANAENFRERAMAAVNDFPGSVEWFVLNAEANVEVDLTALDDRAGRSR
jgi:MFS superfamily sulfate permease-like transporter